MIPAQYYRTIFDILVTIFTIVVIVQYNKKSERNPLACSNSGFTLGIAIFFAIFIGLRPIDLAFVDMVSYAEHFDYLPFSRTVYSWDTDNKVFDNLMLYMSLKGYTVDIFFLIIAGIYYVATYFAVKRLFPGNVFAAYVVWLGSFSTFSYGVNGIKAGAAAALFLLALSFRDKKVWAIILCALSLGFHHSMVVPLVAFGCTLIYRKPSTYLWIWGIALLLSMLHVTDLQLLFANFSDEHGQYYLQTTEDQSGFGGKGGFRFDFVLYSAAPIAAGYYALFKKRLQSQTYTLLFNTYVLINTVWLLCMYASFTNRIAYLSWLMYPIVLTYPFLQMNWGVKRYKMFAQVALYSYLFTMFMQLVYYV